MRETALADAPIADRRVDSSAPAPLHVVHLGLVPYARALELQRAVARENEFTVEEVDLAIHAHPTMSEAIAQAALDSMGKVLDA